MTVKKKQLTELLEWLSKELHGPSLQQNNNLTGEIIKQNPKPDDLKSLEIVLRPYNKWWNIHLRKPTKSHKEQWVMEFEPQLALLTLLPQQLHVIEALPWVYAAKNSGVLSPPVWSYYRPILG